MAFSLLCCCICASLSLASSWPRGFAAPRVEKPIEINGDIYKPVWREVPWSEDFGDIQGDDAPPGNVPTEETRTRMKLRWDDEYLYVAAELTAQNWPIIAEFTDRNSPIFQKDSDFEIFVDTDESTHNYKEFEVNARGTVWNLLLDKSYADGGNEFSGRIARKGEARYWDVQNQKSSTRMHGAFGKPNADGKWTLEVALAHRDTLERTNGEWPAVGKSWRINFSRVEKEGKLNWVWSPQMVWNPAKQRHEGMVAMHHPDVWGYVTFVEADSKLAGPGWVDPSWPLKRAASQVFFAQKYALSDAGGRRFRTGEQLLEEKLIPANEFSGIELQVQANTDGKWTATLREPGKGGLMATTRWDHRFSLSRPSSQVAGLSGRMDCQAGWSTRMARSGVWLGRGIRGVFAQTSPDVARILAAAIIGSFVGNGVACAVLRSRRGAPGASEYLIHGC